MTDQKPSDGQKSGLTELRGLKVQSLSRMIFQADVPEAVIRQLPAQSLYMVIKHNGLHSSSDLIEAVSQEQCQLLLDLDLWSRDRVNEDNLFEWLALPDDTNDLAILQKWLKSVDLKLIAFLIGKYVNSEVFEEATDIPPSPRHHTPDRGRTWIEIAIEDETKHFLMARLLALIFETNAALFYQLMSAPSVATLSVLEEDSFQERNSRLSSEGVPDPGYAASINSPLDTSSALKLLREESRRAIIDGISVVEPLAYEGLGLQPLQALITGYPRREEMESELTLITNAALVNFSVDFSEQDQVLDLVAAVKGAINIGLEVLVLETQKSVRDIFDALGFQALYRLGLSKVLSLRRLARQHQESRGSDAPPDLATDALLEAVQLPFPRLPNFLADEGEILSAQGKLRTGLRTFDHLIACETVRKLLTERTTH